MNRYVTTNHAYKATKYFSLKVMNSHSLHGEKLGDYCDGENYHKSNLFREDPCGLQIQLYYDEVEVCNPIGSKAKKHKLGMVTDTWFMYTLFLNNAL